jgi:hypothetical protein
MSAVLTSAVRDSSNDPTQHSSIDELDRAICSLVRVMNAECYRMLVLVREFDDRMGFSKWTFATCAEWVAWRCGISLSAAREKVRTAQALRDLLAISAAFADGRLSYSKVRALTRVAHEHDEDLLLAYALQATAAQVEERCRQIRNASPESVHGARRAWERRSLTVWRDEAHGTLRLTVELPIDEGELIVRAVDRAVAAGEVASGVEPDATGGSPKGLAWRAQQADALVAVVKFYLDGGGAADDKGGTADHYQVVVHVDEKSLRGGAGRADLPIDTIKRLCCDSSVVTVVETTRENLTLVCTYHHRLLHEGGFRLEREANGELRFTRADGRVIPRYGYCVEDFTDDYGSEDNSYDTPSREGFCTAMVQGA